MSTLLTARRVEQHMGTVVSLASEDVDAEVTDRFFDRIATLESLLTRFRIDSQISRIGRGDLHPDDADPAVREVLQRCERLRELTDGDFDHEPRAHRDDEPGLDVAESPREARLDVTGSPREARLDVTGSPREARLDVTGSPRGARLDVNALAKGWIVDEASTILRVHGTERFFVNAGGDVRAVDRARRVPWRIGIQHPEVRNAMLAVLELHDGAVATSGTYERGEHLRGRNVRGLTSVTVVGPELGTADALSTAVFASGQARPPWWHRFEAAHALLTVTACGTLRWYPAREADTGTLRVGP